MAKVSKNLKLTKSHPAQRAAPRRHARTNAEPTPKLKGKLGTLVDTIRAAKGANLSDLSATLGWQPHTTRAAISRLRKRGYAIELVNAGNHSAARYRLATAKTV